MEQIFFALFNPWHATWLSVMVGIVLLALAVLAIHTTIRSKVEARIMYALVSVFLTIAGITMVIEGLSLGSHMNALAHPPSYAVQKAAYYAHNWPLPSHATSMLNVFIVLVFALAGALLVEILRQTGRRELAAIGGTLVAASVTVATDIMLYHFFGHALAVLTFLSWGVTIAAAANAIREILRGRTRSNATSQASE